MCRPRRPSPLAPEGCPAGARGEPWPVPAVPVVRAEGVGGGSPAGRSSLRSPRRAPVVDPRTRDRRGAGGQEEHDGDREEARGPAAGRARPRAAPVAAGLAEGKPGVRVATVRRSPRQVPAWPPCHDRCHGRGSPRWNTCTPVRPVAGGDPAGAGGASSASESPRLTRRRALPEAVGLEEAVEDVRADRRARPDPRSATVTVSRAGPGSPGSVAASSPTVTGGAPCLRALPTRFATTSSNRAGLSGHSRRAGASRRPARPSRASPRQCRTAPTTSTSRSRSLRGAGVEARHLGEVLDQPGEVVGLADHEPGRVARRTAQRRCPRPPGRRPLGGHRRRAGCAARAPRRPRNGRAGLGPSEVVDTLAQCRGHPVEPPR